MKVVITNVSNHDRNLPLPNGKNIFIKVGEKKEFETSDSFYEYYESLNKYQFSVVSTKDGQGGDNTTTNTKTLGQMTLNDKIETYQ